MLGSGGSKRRLVFIDCKHPLDTGAEESRGGKREKLEGVGALPHAPFLVQKSQISQGILRFEHFGAWLPPDLTGA